MKFGEFKLKLHERFPDAPLSPIYIDLRLIRSFPDVLNLTVEVYSGLIDEMRFDLVADVPTAATPIVALLCHKMRVPMISPRRDEKTHGLARRIDGVFQLGQKVLLVDDLITKAESKLETIQILEENGLEVNDVVVLVDREQGGSEELERQGYHCHVGFKLSSLLREYLASNKITKDQFERTIAYLRQN